MADLFIELQDQARFLRFVGGQIKLVEQVVGEYITCTVSIDEKKLQLAYLDYMKNVAILTPTIESRDPDHYKHCGALLNALLMNQPITGVHVISDFDKTDMTEDTAPEEALVEQSFSEFYKKFTNEFSSFHLCFDLCKHYEEKKLVYSRDYIATVCVYLRKNPASPAESHFILFKSLMEFAAQKAA